MKIKALFFLLIASGQLLADDFRDGVVAYQREQFKEAFTLWLPLAEQGNVLAQTLVGSMYAYGQGVERNDDLAFSWFSRAAEVGSAQAQFNLAIMYEKGLGVTADPDKARHWFAAAAKQGREDAVERLALLAENDTIAQPQTEHATPSSDINQPETPAETNKGNLSITRNEPGTRVEVIIEPGDTPSTTKPLVVDEAPVNDLLGPPGIPENTTTNINRLKGAPWIIAQADNHYTIQLAASVQQRLIEAYIRQLKLETHYAHTISAKDGRDWHAIIYGSYPTATAAREALTTFPEEWHTWQPWVRSFASIKKGH